MRLDRRRLYRECCPACGSDQVLAYAVLGGGAEDYGYQCLACAVMWPVLTYPAVTAGPDERRETPAA